MPSAATDPPPEALSAARSGAVSVVDLDAIAANYRLLARRSGTAECAAIVKGDGYGLGMVPVAKAAWAAGARLFFVARLDDGVALRAALSEARIGVLDGLVDGLEAEYERHRLLPVLTTLPSAAAWFRAGPALPAFVHIDTGMNRQGIRASEAAGLRKVLASRSGDGSAGSLPASTPLVAAYLTHFVAADDRDEALCAHQLALLERAVAGLPPAPLSLANSSGLYLDAPYARAITRAGKSLYGINPLLSGAPNPTRQALSVYAPILQMQRIEAGDTVGYAATYRADRQRRIATLGIGYANGYQRAFSGRGVVAFRGCRAPVVGRVSMDLTTVDVGDVPEQALDTGLAEITGPTIGLTELAAIVGSNEHEMQIALGRGCRRVYRGS